MSSNNKESHNTRPTDRSTLQPTNELIVSPEKLKKLTRKEQIFVHEILNNPKQSNTKAALKAYNTDDSVTAASIAYETLRKPHIMAILSTHDDEAQKALADGLKANKNVYRFNSELKGYELVGVEADHQSRLRAADSILDRLHGKAKQVTEVQSTGVTLHIDLTSALSE